MSSNIEKYLNTPGLDIRYFDTIDSTNTAVKRLAETGAAEGLVIISAEQTAGKGRRGRSFYSPQGSGLYMSLLLRPTLSPEKSLYITSAAAAAVAETLENISGVPAGIKWVNDIYMRERKVCGILAEAGIKAGRVDYVVLGIGVNLLPPQGGFPEEIRDVAGAAYIEGDPEKLRARTAAGIIDRFTGYYRTLAEKPFIEEYRRRSILTGQRVNVYRIIDGEPESAAVLGIDDDFGLVVRYDDGREETLGSGEVTIRRI